MSNNNTLAYFLTSDDFRDIVYAGIREKKKQVLQDMINNPKVRNNEQVFTQNDMILSNVKFLDDYILKLASKALETISNDAAIGEHEKERITKALQDINKDIKDFL